MSTRVGGRPPARVPAPRSDSRRDPALDRPSVPAGTDRQDVSTFEVNRRHPGNGQTERIGVPQGPIRAKESPIYDGEGNSMGTMYPTEFGSGHQGGINAGGLTELVLKQPGQAGAGKPVACVWLWDVATTKGPASGWVPVSAISPREAVLNIQRAIDQRIERVRGSTAGQHFAVRTVRPRTAAQAKVDDLYVFPDQHDPVANRAKYFFSGGGKSPLFLNVPKPGDSGRFGITDDIMPPGTEFHVDQSVPPERVGLYHRLSSKEVGQLHFVYGYFVNDAGQKRMGWLNSSLLDPKA